MLQCDFDGGFWVSRDPPFPFLAKMLPRLDAWFELLQTDHFLGGSHVL